MFVSQILSEENHIGEETALDLISGTVGDGLAVKFNAYRKTSAKLPKAKDILEGKVNKLNTKEIGALYSLVISLAYELRELHQKKDKDFWKYMDVAFQFQMDHLPVELNIMSAKTLLKNFNVPIEPDKMKNFDKFFKEYGKYVFATVS
jgi:hypothetical protein